MWTYEEFCANVMILDNFIRFVGLADQKGRIFATAYRPGLQPILTKEEAEASIKDAITRFQMDPSLEEKLGRIVYASTIYEKIKRATIRFNREDVMVITFDPEADHEAIVKEKVLPLLRDKLVV